MRLYLLALGRVRGAGLPVTGALIRHPDGTNVLVDTGAARHMAGDPAAPFEMAPGEHVLDRLAALGLTADDVHLVVNTHLDPDHCGSNDMFPAARFVVQRREHVVALAGGTPRYDWMRPHWDAPGLRYEPVDGDAELLPGVELVATPGHTPGHQSVLVRLPVTGPVLLCGDAIPSHEFLEPDTRTITDYDMDEAMTRASTRRLVELAARENVTMLVHGHDAQRWTELTVAPGYYG